MLNSSAMSATGLLSDGPLRANKRWPRPSTRRPNVLRPGSLDMTVKELREKLAEYDQDALIIVRGYEDGYLAAAPETEIKVYQKPSAWYYGDWWEVLDAKDGPGQKALYIG